jgi:hypothetical protein
MLVELSGVGIRHHVGEKGLHEVLLEWIATCSQLELRRTGAHQDFAVSWRPRPLSGGDTGLSYTVTSRGWAQDRTPPDRRSTARWELYAAVAGADIGVDCSPVPGDRSGVSEPELRELCSERVDAAISDSLTFCG